MAVSARAGSRATLGCTRRATSLLAPAARSTAITPWSGVLTGNLTPEEINKRLRSSKVIVFFSVPGKRAWVVSRGRPTALTAMGGSSSEDDALPTGAGGASSGDSGSESEGNSGSDSSTDSGPAASIPTCPDCGELFIPEGAVLKCRCGVERPASTVAPALRTPQPRAGKPPSGKSRATKIPPKGGRLDQLRRHSHSLECLLRKDREPRLSRSCFSERL